VTSSPHSPSRSQLLAVSHPAVLAVNQEQYAELQDLGWGVHLVVPARWRHEYHQHSFSAAHDHRLGSAVQPLRVVLAGRPQRHFYLARPAAVMRRTAPDVVFVEQEPFSVAGFQWARAAWRSGAPFGLQAAENLDRPMPSVAVKMRNWTLRRAAFVAARSPAAASLVRRWGAVGRIEVIPHPVPGWPPPPRRQANDGTFTVGYAGRLVEEKGVSDLVDAVQMMSQPARLLAVGNGPLLARVQSFPLAEVWTSCPHERMADAYRRMDVLVLPSRRTPKWEEQFGRVLVEALQCGVPVIGARTGEIPWVVDATRGGWTFDEGDIAGLASLLDRVAVDPVERERRARAGQDVVRQRFSMRAVVSQLDALLRDVGTVGAGGRRLWTGPS
jgi:glycosyltransferase involved in cell wall biosynthesis